MVQVVERRIQEAELRGDFTRLEGAGKPLDYSQRHEEMHYRVDPLMAALGRTMSGQVRYVKT